jgi:hypothetical protein
VRCDRIFKKGDRGGQDAHPTKTLISCGTGKMPVAKIKATKTLISCGTGILPVAKITAATTFRTYTRSGNYAILSVAKDL